MPSAVNSTPRTPRAPGAATPGAGAGAGTPGAASPHLTAADLARLGGEGTPRLGGEAGPCRGLWEECAGHCVGSGLVDYNPGQKVRGEKLQVLIAMAITLPRSPHLQVPFLTPVGFSPLSWGGRNSRYYHASRQRIPKHSARRLGAQGCGFGFEALGVVEARSPS